MRENEERSFARVVEALVVAFPAVPALVVVECVERARAKYTDARVRTYLPILVTREARATLSCVVVVEEPVSIG